MRQFWILLTTQDFFVFVEAMEFGPVFSDAFRRMDSSDDGKIHRSEFEAYFGDSEPAAILGTLFAAIDANGDGTLSPEELEKYFLARKSVAPHAPLFRALFALQEAASASLGAAASTAKEESSSVDDRFGARFCMREALYHLRAVAETLAAATGALSESAEQPFSAPSSSTKTAAAAAHQQQLLSAGDVAELIALLRMQQQNARWWKGTSQQLRMAPRHVAEEESDEEDDEIALQRGELHVAAGSEDAFREALRLYVEEARVAGCVAAVVGRCKQSGCFVLHEAWRGADAAERFFASPAARAFRHACADMLARPVATSSMRIPAAWLLGSDQ